MKKLWSPIAGFAGAVTFVVQVIQLWKGDQATVTMVAAGLGAALVFVYLILVTFSKRKDETKKDILKTKNGKGMWRYSSISRGFAITGMVAYLIVGSFGGNALFRHRKELKNKLIILIATFDVPEETYAMTDELTEQLHEAIVDYEDIEIIQLGEKITVSQGKDYAREVGKRYLADLVIWGWYRQTQNPNVTIHVENFVPRHEVLAQSQVIKPQSSIDDLESFTLQQEIGHEMSSLVFFLNGYTHYLQQDYDNALPSFEKALSIQSDLNEKMYRSRLLFFTANTYNNLGRVDDAIIKFTQAIDLDIEFSEAYNNRGYTYVILSEYENAIDDYNKAIELDPEDYRYYYNRGLSLFIQGDAEKAIFDYNKVITLNPENAWAYHNRGYVYETLGEYEMAIADYTKTTELDPENSGALINRGNVHKYQAEIEKAFLDYNKAIELDANNAMAYFNRGVFYDEIGEYEKAIADYTKTIELDPDYVEAYNNRGVTYESLMECEKAIADYTKAIELDPESAGVYNNRGVASESQGEYEKAIVDYTKVIELDPEKFFGYYNRGLAYDALGEYESAIADYTKVLELAPDNAIAYNKREGAIKSQNEKEKALAIEKYNNINDFAPVDVNDYYYRGNFYEALGEYENAIADYTKAIELDLENASAYSNRGNAYKNLGKYQEAITDFTKLIELNPKNSWAYHNRGYSYDALGEHEKAEADYAKAIELDRESAVDKPIVKYSSQSYIIPNTGGGGGGQTCVPRWPRYRDELICDPAFLIPVTGGAVHAIAAGIAHTCAITPEGGVQCWGNNDYGQLGDGTFIGSNTRVDVMDLTGAWGIEAGAYHTCVLVGNEVWCWGQNMKGQIGDGTTTNRNTPVKVLSGAVDVTTGYDYSCAVMRSGQVVCWGDNDMGQLADKETTSYTNILKIDAGQDQICGLIAVGIIRCINSNTTEEVGDTTRVYLDVIMNRFGSSILALTGQGVPVEFRAGIPQIMSQLSGIDDVDSGQGHRCAMDNSGGVHCWGVNYFGQLGDGSRVSSSEPVPVKDLSQVYQLAVGMNHTCAWGGTVMGDTGIECWGLNTDGQLGDGTNQNSPVPVKVK